MNTKSPLDAQQDPDHTVMVPAPGGRRVAKPVESEQADQTIMAAPASPTLGEITGSYAKNVPPQLTGAGLNPLVAAANPLLALVLPLRYMTSHPQVENLRSQLINAIRSFENEAKTARVEHDAIAAARYALCTFLDEIISSTPWGGGGVWASRSLLVTFHNEAFGGEKFFLILQKLCQDAKANLQILELMYLCLALGFEGRFRVTEGGKTQLETLRERLQQLINKERGHYEPALSLHWQGSSEQGAALLHRIPLWVLLAGAAGMVIVLQLILGLSLNNHSDPVFDNLSKVRIATALPTAAPVATAGPVRVAGFLAPEIERGLVSVSETADRSVITLHGAGVFASGSAEVKSEFLPLLQKIGDALKPINGKVLVIGHTDDTKGMSLKFPSNWELSQGRAAAVRDLLAERAGPPERYQVEGRGDSEPIVANTSPENRARNRRVGIIVLAPVNH